MKAKREMKDVILDVIGIAFLIIAMNQIIVHLFIVKNAVFLLWFSNHINLLLGIGILMRKRILVTGELCIALIPETIWSLDFLSKIIFNKYIFAVSGLTQYLFAEGLSIAGMKWQTISSVQHIFIIPLGLLALWLMKADRNGWKVSLLHGSALWVMGFLSGPKYNINCVFMACSDYLAGIKGYMITWLIVGFCFVAISNIFIQKVFRQNTKYPTE